MLDEVAVIEALRRLRAHEPATDDQYIRRDDVGPAWRWPFPLKLALESGERPHLLLHGPIGVGKTTELERWARQLAAYNPVLVRVEAPKDAWDAAWQIHANAYASLAQTTSRTTSTARPPDPEAISSLWRGLSGGGRRILLLIDGLDLIPPSEVTAFFGPGTPLALPALPPSVMVAPHALITSTPATDRDPRFEVVHVWPFPVRNLADRRVDATCAWMAAGLLRRLDGLGIVFDDGIPELIAEMSGGVMRDAVRILRQALISSVGRPSVGTAAAFAGMREVRQDLEQALTDSERAGLERFAEHLTSMNGAVTNSLQPLLPDDAISRIVDGMRTIGLSSPRTSGDDAARPDAVDRHALIRKGAVLVYEGEDHRYELVHPLLRASARRPPGASR